MEYIKKKAVKNRIKNKKLPRDFYNKLDLIIDMILKELERQEKITNKDIDRALKKIIDDLI